MVFRPKGHPAVAAGSLPAEGDMNLGLRTLEAATRRLSEEYGLAIFGFSLTDFIGGFLT